MQEKCTFIRECVKYVFRKFRLPICVDQYDRNRIFILLYQYSVRDFNINTIYIKCISLQESRFAR